ncbi:DUF3150 domain-containing protein [Pseudomonas stutzeri]|jgi:hypothetical protein|uniref:DUF3150 domain-containing protein n=1 Tax=Stutzerimonas frequens TaxID=2968969 RepID=UPI00069A7DCB|nr:DUF3150 domain-containing protein [Stutzerimonas frequens]MBK3919840.1 DUF3150 domain-containing protein [Stutzerimonas frequens]
MTNANVNSSVQIVAQTAQSKVAIFNHLITCISDDRQVDMKDIDVVVGELPKETKKLLCEKIFPTDFLRNYHRIREAAEDVLDKDGSIKTPLGAINSIDSAIEKKRELDLLADRWEKQMEEDEPRYATMCSDHLLQLGAAAIAAGADSVLVGKLTTHLMQRQPTWDVVRKNMKFAYTVHVIDLDGGDFVPELQEAQRDSVVALRDGVMGACIQHVCGEALAILKTIGSKGSSVKNGEVKLNPRTIKRAQAMTNRLEPLSFIHPLIKPLSDALAGELAKLPASGSMTYAEFSNFEQCLQALRDQTLVWERLQKGIPLIEVTTAQQQLLGTSVPMPAQAQAQTTSVAAAPAVVAPAEQASATPASVETGSQVGTVPAVHTRSTSAISVGQTGDLLSFY